MTCLCATYTAKPELCDRSVGPVGANCDCRCHIDAAEAIMRELTALPSVSGAPRARVGPPWKARALLRFRKTATIVELPRIHPFHDRMGAAGHIAKILYLVAVACLALPSWCWPFLALMSAYIVSYERERERLRKRTLPPARVVGYAGKLLPGGRGYEVEPIVAPAKNRRSRG